MQRIVIMNAEGWPGIGHASQLLQNDADNFDLIEESIKLVELESSVRTVGYGGLPNAAGLMQLDASLMDGDTLATAAVGALEGIMHPISVVRELMKRLPHVMLVGAGAKQFALECGFPEADILSPEAKAAYTDWKQKNPTTKLIDLFSRDDGKGCHGTVITLVRNAAGSLSGGISTSGWDFKYPGRLGDSPVIGAGLYVDSRYGGAACTHCGENAIRTSLARSVVLYMKMGASVRDAVAEGMKDLAGLKGGYQGQVVIYAVDKDGEHFVAQRLQKGEPCYYLVYHDGMKQFERRMANYLG
jgi:beta-aspartyl-peptidase (threonine type)